MAKTVKAIQVSESLINAINQCPKKVYYRRRLKLHPKERYDTWCGKRAHSFIKLLYRKERGKRKFYYKTLETAIGGWFGDWNRTCDKEEPNLLVIDKAQRDEYGKLGLRCITHYYKENFLKSDPIAMEIGYNVPWSLGVKLVGKMDQIRTATLDYIIERRPEIVKNGVLLDSYLPEVIVELKTGYFDYEYGAIRSNGGNNEMGLPEIIQAITYTELYRRCHFGKYPVGHVIYDLETGKTRFIVKEGKLCQEILADYVNHVVFIIQEQIYPRSPKKEKCYACDYKSICMREVDLFSYQPALLFSSNPNEPKIEPEQLRFNFKYNKIKPKPPVI